MNGKSTGYNAPIVYKAFAVLEEVARAQSEMGIIDLARRLDISKSTIYGIIRALTDLDVLRMDAETKKFKLGPTLVHLGNQALAGVDLRSIVRPFMDELCQEFNETVFLGTYHDYNITIIEKADRPQELKISAPVGTRIPIFAGAAGKVFLAGLKEGALGRILKERSLPNYTENSITDPQEYWKELEKVRHQGYATDFEEYIQGVNAVSVPLLDTWGWPVAALWMVGFSHSFTREKVEKASLAAAGVAARLKEMLKSL